MHNALNLTLLLQMPDSHPSKGSVDLETLNQDTLRDKLEGGDFLEDTIVGGLVEDNSMLGLVLDLSLGPLLLFGGLATG